MNFTFGAEYTRADIHAALGGNPQSYLPVKVGVVVAACLRLDLNPSAPHVVLCGSGPTIRKAGDLLAVQSQPVPMFIKRVPQHWEYQGLFKVTGSFTAPVDCAPYVDGSGRARAEISRVILLEPA